MVMDSRGGSALRSMPRASSAWLMWGWPLGFEALSFAVALLSWRRDAGRLRRMIVVLDSFGARAGFDVGAASALRLE